MKKTILAPALFALLLSSLAACKRGEEPLLPDAKKSINAEPEKPEPTPPKPVVPVTPVTPVPVEPKPGVPEPTPPVVEGPAELPYVHQIAGSLQSYFIRDKGLWTDAASSPQALIALIDYMQLSGSREYAYVVPLALGSTTLSTDSSVYNAWQAMALVRAFDFTSNATYLSRAQALMDELDASNWDASTCEGGVQNLKSAKSKKLATPTLLYIKLAASLHNRIINDSKNLAYAQKAWNWLLARGLLNRGKLVSNGLTDLCVNDGLQNWTHNQGLFIGAATELSKAISGGDHLKLAGETAAAVISTLSGDGILREANDKTCGPCTSDERSFKGILARYMREYGIVKADQAIFDYLRANAQKAWDSARSNSDAIGFHWQGAFDSADAQRQAAALDLFNATLFGKTRENYAEKRVIQAIGGNQCSASESPQATLDGTASTKWCAFNVASGGITLIVDLGQSRKLERIRLMHAGAAGESLSYNTRNFVLSSGTSETGPWTEQQKVEDNTSSVTVHPFKVETRYIKLFISNGGGDNTARLLELIAE